MEDSIKIREVSSLTFGLNFKDPSLQQAYKESFERHFRKYLYPLVLMIIAQTSITKIIVIVATNNEGDLTG